MDAFKLMKKLMVNYEQEDYYLPKETGLSLIESTVQVSTIHSRVSKWEPLGFAALDDQIRYFCF